MPPQLEHFVQLWRRLDLARQFLLASSAIILVGMLTIGHWLSQRIEDGVTQNTALATALFAESFVGPKLQGLADSSDTHPEIQQELERLMRETPLGHRVHSFKIWRRGAQVVYAKDPSLIGRTFPPTRTLRQAWLGEVAAEFDDLHDAEDAAERSSGLALLEIYVPIRKTYTDEVIAVAEFYEEAGKLRRDIHQAKLESWLMLGGVGFLAVAALYGMIAGASATISQQQRALEGRVSQLSRLLDQNRSLRQRLEVASQRAAEVNERYLRRLGSELHDGPAQLISLALLSLGTDRRQENGSGNGNGVGNTRPAPVPNGKDKVQRVLNDALGEIRHLSHGLSLPELEHMSPAETIREAITAHEQRTGTQVSVEIGNLPQTASHIVKATCYRFVQEALMNAARHAGGKGQKVGARHAQDQFFIEVCDAGPGFDVAAVGSSGRLGLLGLRERLESIGGALTIESSGGHGTALSARVPDMQEMSRHA